MAHVARAVLRTLSAPGFLEGVRKRAEWLDGSLRQLAARTSAVRELRGLGLIRGVQVDRDTPGVVTRARERGLLLVAAGPDVVRLLPPLNTSEEELERGVELLEEALG